MKNRSFNPDVDAPKWTGGNQPYDIIKEGTIALIVVALLTLGLSAFFGSPDEVQVTMKNWSQAQPLDFANTALAELNGTSGTAGYGPPYNSNSDGMHMGPIYLQKWAGVRIPINTAQDFVLMPLSAMPHDPTLTANLNSWNSATDAQHTAWLDSYGQGTIAFSDGHVVNNAQNAGPVPILIDDLTQMAMTGALDQALVAGKNFYTLDYTKPLLFLADGEYFAGLATDQHLAGDQWGMMNETGSYPGQAWLWLYTFWYQVPPFSTSWADNADVYVWAWMMILTLGMIFVPFIPGLRSIPRWTRVYRLIWREHYKNLK